MRLFFSFSVLSLACVLTISATSDSPEKQVDQLFSAYDKPDSPGCALGVIRDGDFIYRKGYGMASLELAVPLSPQSVFYMGSVSKQFTAAAVVLAAEQGFLSLDDDVRKYIPELPDYGHVITLRQMLHHTSGFPDFLVLFELAGRNVADVHSEAGILDLIARQKHLNNIPGDEWIYSNTNYFLAGVVIRRATNKSLADFAADNIFTPLGMAHTRFYDDHTLIVPGRAAAYDPGKNGKFLVDWSTDYDVVGAGGLMSTVDDLLLWDRNFYTNKLGKGTLVKELQTRGLLTSGKPIAYALGLSVDTYRGLPTVEHGGALYGYRTGILRFPEQKFTVVCLCNVADPGVANLSHKVADIYLRDRLASDASPAPSASASGFPDPAQFAGKYLDPNKHFAYTFTASGDTLSAWGSKLRRLGPDQFHDLGTGVITFKESSGGMKSTLVMDGDAFFAGQRVQDSHLSEQQLAAYSGRYHSEELDATYDLFVEKGRLMLRRNWNAPLALTPLTESEFECPELGANFVFQRDANQRVRGFAIFTTRSRDTAFGKID